MLSLDLSYNIDAIDEILWYAHVIIYNLTKSELRMPVGNLARNASQCNY